MYTKLSLKFIPKPMKQLLWALLNYGMEREEQFRDRNSFTNNDFSQFIKAIKHIFTVGFHYNSSVTTVRGSFAGRTAHLRVLACREGICKAAEEVRLVTIKRTTEGLLHPSFLLAYLPKHFAKITPKIIISCHSNICQ